MAIVIERYSRDDKPHIVDLSLKAWAPVFALMEQAMPAYIYDAFYPNGWTARQLADIEALLDEESETIWIARDDACVVGWIGIRIHPDDRMGEIYIIAVDPTRQREGIASLLMEASFAHMRKLGMKMAMVETGGDPGHEASRATYEKAGFERWPVARYFRQL